MRTPPPSPATCSAARSSSATSTFSSRKLGWTTTPAPQCGGETLSLRYTCAYPTGSSRPSTVASTPAESVSEGWSRSRHTASPSEGWPSIASASSCSRVTATSSGGATDCSSRVRITASRVLVGPRYVRPMARPRGARQRAGEVVRRLADEYPGTATELCALQHVDPYQLLVATILSAQSTDEMVNTVTPAVFERYPTPSDLAHANPDDVEKMIHSTGFFRSKTRSLIGMARGVDRKTGNVIRSVAFDLPGLPVDTHVTRLVRRLKLTNETDAVKIELDLNGIVEPEERGALSLRLILHGRQVCKARKPRCDVCVLADICPSAFKV